MNAQKELLTHIEGREVALVKIIYRGSNVSEPLRIEGRLEEVLPKLAFDYDSGYGGQELFGFIWYTDGTWSDRGEYDGAEWWQHQQVPDKDAIIPGT